MDAGPRQAAVPIPAVLLGVVTCKRRPTQHHIALTHADLGIVHTTVEAQECIEAPMRQVT